MAKRSAKKVKAPDLRSADSGTLLKEALAVLRRGGTDKVISMAKGALEKAETPAQKRAAQELIAEVYVRMSAKASPEERLTNFTKALETLPNTPRFHYYRGLTYFSLGRLEEARTDLEAAQEYPAAQPYLTLLKIAAGEKVMLEGLEPEVANTLTLIAELDKLKEAPSALLGREQAQELWGILLSMAQDPQATPHEALATVAKRSPNMTVKRFALYYGGVAALRDNNPDEAERLFKGLLSPGVRPAGLENNLALIGRERALGLADSGDFAALTTMKTPPGVTLDNAQKEALAVAHEHQGYKAAQGGAWMKALEHWQNAFALRPRRELAQNLALAAEASLNPTAAAAMWRDMLKRRPRKKDHPDYLSDTQVAAIWRHAGELYAQAEEYSEAVHCFKSALKYADDDLELRFALANALMENEQQEAATNEFERILERDPEHKEALVHLAMVYDMSWNRDSLPLWKRALALDPQNPELRDAVASVFLKNMPYDAKTNRQYFENALELVPDHPLLLTPLGTILVKGNKKDQVRALELLKRAYPLAPKRAEIVGMIVLSLVALELDGAQEALEETVADLKSWPDLMPAFWFDKAENMVEVRDEPPLDWMERFIEQGLHLTKTLSRDMLEGGYSYGSGLACAYELMLDLEEEERAESYYERIKKEAAQSGALEYIEAYRLHLDGGDNKAVEATLQKAERKAKRSRDGGLYSLIERLRREIRGTTLPSIEEMMRRLRMNPNLGDLF